MCPWLPIPNVKTNCAELDSVTNSNYTPDSCAPEVKKAKMLAR